MFAMASSCLPSISFGKNWSIKVGCLIWDTTEGPKCIADFRPKSVGLDQPVTGKRWVTGLLGLDEFHERDPFSQHMRPFQFLLGESYVGAVATEKVVTAAGSSKYLSVAEAVGNWVFTCNKEHAEAFVLELLTKCRRVNHGSKKHSVSKQRSLGLDIMGCSHRLHPALWSLPDRLIFGRGLWKLMKSTPP